MFSYACINSHSQVSDPGSERPHVLYVLNIVKSSLNYLLVPISINFTRDRDIVYHMAIQ